MKKMIGVLLVAAAVVLVVQGAGWGLGGIYDYVNIQGRLTDSGGTAVAAGHYPARLNLYHGYDISSLTLITTGSAYTYPHDITVNSNGLFSYNIPVNTIGGYLGVEGLWMHIYVTINSVEKDFGVQRVTAVPLALRALYADNVASSGLKLPYADSGDVKGSAFTIVNTNTTSLSATGLMGVGGRAGGPGVWGIATGTHNGIGVVGQSLVNISLIPGPGDKTFKSIGVYGASDGVGVVGGGPTVAWGSSTTLTTESANIGVAGFGKSYGVLANSTGGAGLMAYAPRFGAVSVSTSNTGGIGLTGLAMANWSTLTPNKSIGVYGGSDYIGVCGGGSYTWTGGPDIVTKEAANVGVWGAGSVSGVVGSSGANIGVSGLGPVAGVSGAGKYGVLGVGYNDGGVGVVGYHNANKLIVGGLGSYWLTSTSEKKAAGATGTVFHIISLVPVLQAQGALGTYYGTDLLAGAYGRIEDGQYGAGVVGIGGTTGTGGYFSSGSFGISSVGTTAGVYGTGDGYGGLFSSVNVGIKASGNRNEIRSDDETIITGKIIGDVGTAYSGTKYGSGYSPECLIVGDTTEHSGYWEVYVPNDVAVGGTLAADYVKYNHLSAISDLRLKTNIEKMSGVLGKLQDINAVKFSWRTEEQKKRDLPKSRQIGVIAQEVEKQFPELVLTDKDGYKSVQYDKLTAVLLEAVKELKAQNDKLEARVKALEKK